MTAFDIIMIAALFFLLGANLAIRFVLDDDDDSFSLFAFGLLFTIGCYNVYETISLLP